jgi:hypothetical protein
MEWTNKMAKGQKRPVSVGESYVQAGGDVNGVTTVRETIGAIFLGLLSLAMLIALQRAEARNRQLMQQLMQCMPQHHESSSSE